MWEYDQNSLPASTNPKHTQASCHYIFYYDDHNNIMRVDMGNNDNGEYAIYEPQYTYVEHPSVWAYVCSRMYDIFPPVY